MDGLKTLLDPIKILYLVITMAFMLPTEPFICSLISQLSTVSTVWIPSHVVGLLVVSVVVAMVSGRGCLGQHRTIPVMALLHIQLHLARRR